MSTNLSLSKRNDTVTYRPGTFPAVPPVATKCKPTFAPFPVPIKKLGRLAASQSMSLSVVPTPARLCQCHLRFFRRWQRSLPKHRERNSLFSSGILVDIGDDGESTGGEDCWSKRSTLAFTPREGKQVKGRREEEGETMKAEGH